MDTATQIEEGNIDLHSRPKVRNPDGSISTVRSASFNFGDGRETLLPTVAEDGSRTLNEEEAVQQYRRTGKHLGKFKTPEAATAYAEQLHRDQEKEYVKPQEQASTMRQAPSPLSKRRASPMLTGVRNGAR